MLINELDHVSQLFDLAPPRTGLSPSPAHLSRTTFVTLSQAKLALQTTIRRCKLLQCDQGTWAVLARRDTRRMAEPKK